MTYFDVVEDIVSGFRVGEARVTGYRLALAEVTQSELGIESNRAGSPYAPLEVSSLCGGSFVVQWSDGRLSKGAISRAPAEALEEVLRSAWEGRYEDPDDAVFPAVAEVPRVALFCEATGRMATGEDVAALPGMLDVVRRVAGDLQVSVLDASARAARSRRRVLSSGGFRAEWESTHLSFSCAFDSLVWDSHARREVLAPEEVEALCRRTGEDLRCLRGDAGEIPRGPHAVLLHPRVAEPFLRAFLFSNLSGAAVANGRSRFTPEQFRSGERCFREDLALWSDPLRDLGTGSFRCTDEGVPARRVDFVENGRLRTPALGLKYSRRLGMAPAPLAASFDGYHLALRRDMALAEALAGPEDVLVVHSVLGLHTQDPVRGDYSLLAPQGVLVKGGRPAGRVAVTLNGSFFEDLSGPDLALVRYRGFCCPGLRLVAELS